MYKIGITGGIGSGKSTVCALFADRGVAVYDSDSRAKRLMNEDAALREALSREFGACCYAVDGSLDRAYLEDFRQWAETQNGPYVLLESAILFEAGFESEVDATLAVLAPLEERVRRTSERDGMSRDEVLKRIAHQMSDDELHARADRTVVNIRRDYLESDVEQLHKIYTHEAER